MDWETSTLQVIYMCMYRKFCLACNVWVFSKQTLKLHMNLTAVFWFIATVRTVRHAVTVARLRYTHAEGALELVLGACAVLLVIVRCRCVTEVQK